MVGRVYNELKSSIGRRVIPLERPFEVPYHFGPTKI